MTEHQQSTLKLGQFHSRFFFYNTLYIKKNNNIMFLYHFLIHLCKNPEFPRNATTDKVLNWKNTVRYLYLQHSRTVGHKSTGQ